MPRFYFDITDGDRTEHDNDGTELIDLAQARERAMETLGEIAKDELPDGDHRKFSIRMRDESGKARILLALTLLVERLD